jgi:hypothetical protein
VFQKRTASERWHREFDLGEMMWLAREQNWLGVARASRP